MCILQSDRNQLFVSQKSSPWRRYYLVAKKSKWSMLLLTRRSSKVEVGEPIRCDIPDLSSECVLTTEYMYQHHIELWYDCCVSFDITVGGGGPDFRYVFAER